MYATAPLSHQEGLLESPVRLCLTNEAGLLGRAQPGSREEPSFAAFGLEESTVPRMLGMEGSDVWESPGRTSMRGRLCNTLC